MKKLVLGVTAPGSVILLEGQVDYFVSRGYDVFLMTQDDEVARNFCIDEGCQFLPLKIKRDISLFNDFYTLLQIVNYFASLKPDIVNVGTSKMGFLGIIAAYLTRVPYRIYTSRGLRFETEKGFKRFTLKLVLKIIGFMAHKVVCISEAIRERAEGLNLFPSSKTRVIGYGSSNGINLHKFHLSKEIVSKSRIIRDESGLNGAFVFGFVGRLNNRKGINELYHVFDRFSKRYRSKLILLGKIEHANLGDSSLIDKINAHPDILYLGFRSDIPLYMTCMDTFILPTWSEGFGTVFIQAAAMGVPVIGTRVSGVQNAVSENFNGFLTELKNQDDIYQKMERLYLDKELRQKFSQNGILWAQNFRQKVIWEGLFKIYNESR